MTYLSSLPPGCTIADIEATNAGDFECSVCGGECDEIHRVMAGHQIDCCEACAGRLIESGEAVAI